MTLSRLLTTWLCCIWIATSSCSQTTPAGKEEELFAGSTPCDNFIYATLKISSGDPCEFIKWELGLQKGQNDEGRFRLTALYGEGKPNTNGFKDEKKTVINGKYKIEKGIDKYAHLYVYRLEGSNNPDPIFLVEMDKNIFHFANQDKKLLVGNGGWGYVLNKIK